MDQEVSRSAWLGGSLIMIVAAIAIALVIYGLSRTVAAGYIDNMSKVLLDKNYSELTELNGTTISMSKAAVIGLVDRNNLTITKATIIKPNGSSVVYKRGDATKPLTPLNIQVELSKDGMRFTNYNIKIDVDLKLGTATLIIYVGK